MSVYKISDIISCEFLKIPKSMFANEKYRVLSSDAKLTYALLYDRLSLSKLNGWINDKEEVYLIYTREEISEDLGITYKKAISAFKELLSAGLIREQRCGRGMPNKIYIVKIEISEKQAKDYVKKENLRTADSVCLENTIPYAYEELGDEDKGGQGCDMQNGNIKNCQNGISRTAEQEGLDMPKSHPNNTDNNQTYKIQIDNSQSVLMPMKVYAEVDNNGPTDDMYSLDEILENCQLEIFPEEERKILYDALERLFYSKELKIGNAILPQSKVRSRMYEITASILTSVMSKLHTNDREIKNITGYIMTTIFNAITEEYSLLHVDPYLNYLRSVRKEE